MKTVNVDLQQVCNRKRTLMRKKAYYLTGGIVKPFFDYLSVQLEAISIFSMAYSHACKTKEEKDTS